MNRVEDPARVDPQAAYPNFGIYSFARGVFGKPPIDGAKTSARTLYRVKGGQFIYSKLFAFEGAYALVPQSMDGYYVSNEYPTFDCDPDRVLPTFLRWLFSLPPVWRAVALDSKGMGDRRQRVYPDQLLAYQIPLPPLDEQRRIVARLDRVAELVEERRRLSDEAEADVRALLTKAFAHVVDGAPRRPMGEVAPLVRRQVEIDPEAEYTEIGVKSFYRGIFHRRTAVGSEFSWQNLFWIKEGDLIFSNLMAWEQAVAVASIQDEATVGNHRMLTCAVDPSLAMPGFIFAYFQTSEGFSSLVGHSPGSIARNKTLSSRKLSTVEVPLPSLQRQRWFGGIQEKVRQIREIRAATAKDVEGLLPAMLHQIFKQAVRQPEQTQARTPQPVVQRRLRA